MKAYAIFVSMLIISVIFCWIVNFVKLAECDFKAPYKCEVVHGLGVVPQLSIFTVWFDSDK